MPLAKKILQLHISKMGRTPVDLDSTAIAALKAHLWPGNVRELDNVMQRALIMQPGNVVSDFHLRLDPFSTDSASSAEATLSLASLEIAEPADSEQEVGSLLGVDLQRREFEIIADTLRIEGGSRKNAAEKLGISPRTLRYKLARMRDMGMSVESVLQSA